MKAISLISTGIDSPVASHLIKKQGFEIVYLHMKTAEGKSENLKALIDIIDPNAKLITEDYRPYLNKVRQKATSRFGCVLCKRGMFKRAEEIAKEIGADAIISGDNLGQVASQTIENMKVISSDISLPILRPLLCLDKQEIIDIARELGTYKISAKDTGKCPFLPDSPATKSKLEVIRREEEKLND